MRTFEEYLEEGIVKRQSPDLSRARALQIEAKESYDILHAFLKEGKLSERTANHVIKNAYDIIIELIRAKLLTKGYNAQGFGAHEAEVAYLVKLGLSAQKVEFADKLRYFRNGILYYGKSFDKAYAKKVLAFLEEIRKLTKK